MKTKSLVLILLAALLLSIASPAGASGTTVVKPSALNGWSFLLESGTTGAGDFTLGPGTPPLGSGSAHFTLGASSDGILIGAAAYGGTKLADITRLEYSTYEPLSSASTVQVASLQFNIDNDLTDLDLGWKGRLVFEPYYSETIVKGSWQTWDTLTQGRWWATGAPMNSVCSIGTPCTWADVLTNFPNAGVHTVYAGVLLKAGSGWPSGSEGHVDALTIGVSGDDTTFDFEPETACSAVCYADAVNGDDSYGGDSPASAKKTIQAALDAVSPSGSVRVLPGNYDETATNRWVLGTNGPHQFGLFVDKDGVTIQGVDSSDTPITDFNALQAYVTTNATNNFGFSGIFVEGDNVTIAGLRIGPNIPGDNKTVEIIGDNFTLKDSHVDVPGGGSVYFNDWQFDTLNDVSYIQAYTIDHNLFDQSASLDITSGAGYSGPVSGRQITDNEFNNADAWPSVSFNGSGTGVPWFVQSVGGAEIEDNTFMNTFSGNDVRAGHIRVRGLVDVSQFDWTAYWNDNAYNKAVVVLVGAYPPFDVRQYNYTSGSYSFDVRRIGVNIQGGVDTALAGDTVLVKAGTYEEQVAVPLSLTLLGESGAASTFIVAPSTLPVASDPDSTIVKIAGAGVSVDFSGFTVTGPGPSGCGSINAGIFVRDDAYANIHDNRILDIRDDPFSGCQNGVGIQVGRAALSTSGSADIADNVISGYQKNGVTVSNVGSFATIENNTITGAGPSTIIAQNGVQVSGGATGAINWNSVSNHSYSPGSYTSTGVLIYGSDADTYGNTLNENQTGVYHIEGSGVHEANILSVTTAGTGSPYLYGFVIDAPPPGLNPAPFEDNFTAPSAPSTTFTTFALSAVQDVDVLNNELTGDGTSASYGIGAYAGYGSLDIDLTVLNNKVINFGTGLDIFQCTGGGCTTSVFTNVLVNLNSITGNADYGLLNTDAIPVNAELNWWNSADGPAPTGSGDEASGDVDYTPWLCVGTDTSTDTGFQPIINTDCDGPIITIAYTFPSWMYLNGWIWIKAVADDTATGNSNIASAEYNLNNSGWLPMTTWDAAFDEPNEFVKAYFKATSLGLNEVCVRATDAWGNVGDPVCTNFTVKYKFSGFYHPVDMGHWVNFAKDGKTVPIKFRLTDAYGYPVSDPASFVGLLETNVSCTAFNYKPTDWIEFYSTSTGLQYLGHGYWQYNWHIPNSYDNTCLTIRIQFNDGTITPEAKFKIK
ncbi:MAG: PxKF domain-containing protein [Anaerolineales bacterium]|nr:PxKF domain-containing protein [Anaerolineales bacterium]